MTEVIFLIVALHNLDRAALRILEVVDYWYKDQSFFIHSLRSMTYAHAIFRRNVPDRKLLRDILMHADEYAYGIGSEQRRSGITTPYRARPSRFKNKHVVECGGRTLIFDIPKVEAALEELSLGLIDVWVDFDEVMDPDGEAHQDLDAPVCDCGCDCETACRCGCPSGCACS